MAMVRSSTCLAGALVAAGVLAACGGSPATAPPKTPSPNASSADVVPRAAAKQASFDAAAIDAALHEAWQKQGLAPSPRADDATFVRRAYIDIVGTIPTPADTTAFVASTAPDKRQKLVDSLLASPAYAEHWMNYWDDVLMGRET
jgi:hypothetical protein